MTILEFKEYAKQFMNCDDFLKNAKTHKTLKTYKKEILINLYFSLMF